jgi:hypothetical protein
MCSAAVPQNLPVAVEYCKRALRVGHLEAVPANHLSGSTKCSAVGIESQELTLDQIAQSDSPRPCAIAGSAGFEFASSIDGFLNKTRI